MHTIISLANPKMHTKSDGISVDEWLGYVWAKSILSSRALELIQQLSCGGSALDCCGLIFWSSWVVSSGPLTHGSSMWGVTRCETLTIWNPWIIERMLHIKGQRATTDSMATLRSQYRGMTVRHTKANWSGEWGQSRYGTLFHIRKSLQHCNGLSISLFVMIPGQFLLVQNQTVITPLA